MAASAYAASASISHVLEQLQHPVRHWLRYDRNQIETLHEMVGFMLDFFEAHSTAVYDTDEEDILRDMANCIIEAEDLIDSHVVDQLRARSADKVDMGCLSFCRYIDRVIQKFKTLNISRAMGNFITGADDVDFYQDLDRIIQMFKILKKEFAELREEKRIRQEQQPSVSLAAAAGSSAPPAPSGKNTMVGFGDHMARIMDLLTGGESGLQVVPIVGMGGIGKTTLAKNIFHDPCFKNYFEVRIWFTISQEYRVADILLGLLGEEKGGKSQNISELGQKLRKKLFGRRYLIVLDDVWSVNVWDDLKLYFPDTSEGSRIIVTTRLSSIFDSLGNENYLVDFLDNEKSWELLCEKAFGKKGCPDLKLEKIGRRIASDCKGLPLAIVVIGGLLLKSDVTLKKWKEVAKNVNSIVNSEDDELCLNILSLSYQHLPIHLKPCFLYMRVYPEDYNIRVSQLVQSWIGEGFVISKGGKSLEEVAWEYLKDLIDRNLILTNYQFNYNRGMKKMIGIHDLLRDLCIRENRKANIFPIGKVFVHKRRQSEDRAKGNRIYRWCGEREPCVRAICKMICPHIYRIWPEDIIRHKYWREPPVTTKLRYFDVRYDHYQFYTTWLHLYWNLQTLALDPVDRLEIDLPSEIWNMPQLRHVMIYKAILPEPPVTPIDGKDSVILESLETLGYLADFSCSEETLARIPNVRKLTITDSYRDRSLSYFEYHNLTRLHKLESLTIFWNNFSYAFPTVMFPRSLKKLRLQDCKYSWKDMTIIGSLPNLEVLKLCSEAFEGSCWNPVEGEFLQLKKLSISAHSNLGTWNAEKEHFPKLESLVLSEMGSLKNFPSGIGEIDTLLSITLYRCLKELVNSAKEVVEEQQTYGNEGIQLHVTETLELPRHFGVHVLRGKKKKKNFRRFC